MASLSYFQTLTSKDCQPTFYLNRLLRKTSGRPGEVQSPEDSRHHDIEDEMSHHWKRTYTEQAGRPWRGFEIVVVGSVEGTRYVSLFGCGVCSRGPPGVVLLNLHHV
jgi:hypothetical protein